MLDSFDREINYMRISVTDRCNLKCLYCIPEEEIIKKHHNDILRYEEIYSIVKEASKLGVSKVRITGGEPLVRKNIEELIKMIRRIEDINIISMTTNGILLKSIAYKLKEAGLDSINISLDTLDYEEMIQTGNAFIREYALFMRNLKNILAALNGKALGFSGDEISKELIGDYPLIYALTKSSAADFGLGREIPYINSIIDTFNSSDKADPYNLENVECSLVNGFLDRLTSIKSFTTDNLFAYYINLTYAVSINGRNEEEGKKHLQTLVNSLKNEASAM